jgi:hypothetical protein
VSAKVQRILYSFAVLDLVLGLLLALGAAFGYGRADRVWKGVMLLLLFGGYGLWRFGRVPRREAT